MLGIDVLEPVLPAGLGDGPHLAVHGDVCSDKTWQRAKTALRGAGGSFAVLANNAALQLESPLLETSVADFMRLYEVNAVCPGAVRTELTTRVWEASADPAAARAATERLYPRGTIGEPTEIAAVVAFLAGPQSTGMTGALVSVDGGLTATNAEYGVSAQFIAASRTTEQRSGDKTR